MSRDERRLRKLQERRERFVYDGPPLWDDPGHARWCAENAEWINRAEADHQKWRAEVIAANVAELDRKSLVFPAVTTPSVTLNKSCPLATLIVSPWIRRTETDYGTWVPAAPSSAGRPARRGRWKETQVKSTFGMDWPKLLTVTGLGPHRGRRKRRGVVDVIVMGFRGELSQTGVTSDGRMGLPDIATHVRLRLNDPKAEVVVGAAFGWARIPAEWLPSKLYVEPKERDPFT